MFLEDLAEKILDIWMVHCSRNKRSSFSSRVEKELGILHPGSNVKKLVYDFYVKKIAFCCLIALLGLLLLLLYILSSAMDREILDQHYLERDGLEGAQKTVVLDAQVGEVQISDLEIEIEPKQLSKEEIKVLLEKISAQLPVCILGENATLSYVDKPLELMDSWEEAPVSIYWESSDREVIAEDGSLHTEGIMEEGKEVVLTATMICEDLVKEKEICVRVYPPVLSKEEEIRKKLLGLLDKQQKSSSKRSYFELPEEMEGDPIVWKEPVAEYFPVLFLLLIVCVGVIFGGKDSELHKEYEKRNKQLLLEYPEFVSKLQLLLCSGMSIRSAFARMGKEYLKKKKRGGKIQYVCEELLLAVRKMENGMPETDALKLFGERCNLFCYKKLVSLILQNLKRGTEGLKDSLMSESRNAFEERKQTARKLGEEAGTKLLLPMMLMMGIVLVIVVIPAFFSFGGIY